MNKFSLIGTDFPWQYNQRNNPDTKFGKGMNTYQGMKVDEILEIAQNYILPLCEENCAIMNWMVPPKFNDYVALKNVFEAAGFRHVTKIFCWVKVDKEGKPRAMPGHYTLSNTEDCYLMVRGKIPINKKGEKQIILAEDLELQTEEIYAPVVPPHSKKPLEWKDRSVLIFGDVPRLEIFARGILKKENGWVLAGNEVKETAGMDIREALNLIKEEKYGLL